MTRDHNCIKAGRQSNKDPFTFVLSTEAVDRQGDIIRQKGWNLRDFKQNPIALFGHRNDFPIGQWVDVRVEDGQLVGKLVPAEPGTSYRTDEVRKLIEQRILKACSVGFTVDKYEPIDKDEPYGGWDIQKQTLLETSVVSVPANPEAISRAKSLHISDNTMNMIFDRKASGVYAPRRKAVTTPGVSATGPTQKRKEKPMKLGDKIEAAEQRLEDLRGDVADITQKSIDETRDLTGEETDQIEALTDDIEATDASLRGLKTAEKALASRAEKRDRDRAAPTNFVPARAAEKEVGGTLLAKMATVQVLSHVLKKSPDDILRERYSSDGRVEAMVKSATSTATTTSAGWAAELVESDVMSFINELEAVSVYGALSSAGVSIPFGNNATITVPHRTGSGNVSGSFVGENATIPVKQDAYGSTTFSRYKCGVISTFTNELARTSTPQVESLLRDAIRQDTGDMLDSVLCNPANAAVAGIRPASPWNGAANQASAGTDLASILTDIRFLLDTLAAANAGRTPRIVMNPARLSGLSMITTATGSFVFRSEIGQGTLMGVPLIVSTNCPADHVFIVDAADYGTAFGVPEFDVSDQATVVMVSDDGTDPTMADTNAVNVAGSVKVSDAAGVTGGPAAVKSMWQHWSVSLRMILPVSWGMMRTGTTAYITGVAW